MRKKILYAVQGTGNGHVARARQILPILAKYHDVDVFLGGNQSEVALPFVPKFYSRGLVMHYNKKGGVSIWKTIVKNNYFLLLRDIFQVPVQQYDLVINDFEFVTAWACKLRKWSCLQMSHQASFLSKNSPRPEAKQWMGEFILKNYAPSDQAIGFHFEMYDGFILPPIIRDEIRQLKRSKQNHITVYLPAFHHDYLLGFFKQIPNVNWHIFSKFANESVQVNNVFIKPINNELFIESFGYATGVICGAGFETPAEALFLEKKLMVLPISGQYEQACNAAALAQLGVTVVQNIDKDFIQSVMVWLNKPALAAHHYTDFTEILLSTLDLNATKAQIARSISQVNFDL